MTSVAGLALLGVIAPASLGAQVCAGSPSLGEMRFRAAAGIADYAYANAIGATFSTGKAVYGTLGVGTSYDREQDARTYDLSILGGVDVADSARRVYLCPLVAFAVSLGPYDYLLSEMDYRYVDASAGFGIAVVAMRSSRLTIIPGGGARVARIIVSQIPSPTQRAAGVPGWTRGDTYLLFTAGIGVAFAGAVTIRPEVTLTADLVPVGEPHFFAVPFGREENDVSLGISMGISFGRRKP